MNQRDVDKIIDELTRIRETISRISGGVAVIVGFGIGVVVSKVMIAVLEAL